MQDAANYATRYAEMSDGELAEVIADGLESLNEEARHAFHGEIKKRGLPLAELRGLLPPELRANDLPEDAKGSLLMEFGVFPGLPIGFVLVGALYAFLLDSGNRFANQVVTLVAYTGLVFLFVFCNWSKFKGYDLRRAAVRRKLPRLLAIHAVFLIVLFAGVTIVPRLQSAVPMRLKLDAVNVEWLEKAAVLYYWANGKYHTIQVSD